MNYPAFIATKGRAGKAPTIERLLAEGVKPIVVVEPNDRQTYYNAYPDAEIAVLPENDKGITYARNFCLNRAREMGVKWFWMMDDDIKDLFVVQRKKCVKVAWKPALGAAEKHISRFQDAAIGALEYQQYAWSSTSDYAFNSYCDVCVLISVEKTMDLSYTPEVKEDRDFVLQVLQKGFAAVRTRKIAFTVPKNGSNKGGLHDLYASGKERRWSENMIKKWPGICEWNIKKDGRPDVKINWKLLRKPTT